MVVKASPDRAAEEGSALRKPLMRRVNSFARLHDPCAGALSMFYRQGFTIEAYDAAERDVAEVNAPRLPTNIRDLRPETVMLKNGARSMIDELEKVGDVTLCRLMTGGSDPEHEPRLCARGLAEIP